MRTVRIKQMFNENWFFICASMANAAARSLLLRLRDFARARELKAFTLRQRRRVGLCCAAAKPQYVPFSLYYLSRLRYASAKSPIYLHVLDEGLLRQ